MKGRGIVKGRGMKGRRMVKGRGMVKGSHCRSWVVLGPRRHLHVCCRRLATCCCHMFWLCPCFTSALCCHSMSALWGSLVIVVVPVLAALSLSHIFSSVIVLCLSRVGWDELRGVVTVVP